LPGPPRVRARLPRTPSPPPPPHPPARPRQAEERMFAYSPTRRRDVDTAMNPSDPWSGTPVLVATPAPSLELGAPSAWCNGKSSGRVIGEIDIAATPA